MRLTGDTKKTLEILKERGSRGIHSFELNEAVGTFRCAARIRDLKNVGYNITSVREKLGDAYGARYTLVTGTATQSEATPQVMHPILQPVYEFDNEKGTARLVTP